MLSESANPAAVEESRRRDESGPGESWLQRRDVLVVGLIVALWIIGLLLPEARWPVWARRIADRRLGSSDKLTKDELATVGVVVGTGKDDWIERTFRRDWLAHKYLSWIQLLACYRPWRSCPKPELIGRKHLDDALARGQGVILLTANFAYKDLMAKAALAEAGYWASHLVRDSHGFAESRLGRRLLNPIHSGIERRFLHERLVFSGDRTGRVNTLIKERLRANRMVLVTVTPLGRRLGVLPFLYGRIRIATGALNFACETGAVVLPVFTIRKPDGRIETIVEHPLKASADASRADMIQAMLEDYVPRLETYVAQYPDQFSFPTSDRHGRALIEPWMSARPERADRHPAPVREAVPELT